MIRINLIDDIWEKQVKKQIIRHQKEVKENAKRNMEEQVSKDVDLLIQGICGIALGIFVGYLIWGL